jgi:SAM-dependent methyltransferase
VKRTGPQRVTRRPAAPQQECRLYGDLAKWWPLLSPPSHYGDEAAQLNLRITRETGWSNRRSTAGRGKTALELGCGGGSLARHLKQRFAMTLVDRSPQMLKVSRAVNPECEHLRGDMTTLRLSRQFDFVLIHDAIEYMTTEAMLRATFATAAAHCKPGGLFMVVPDCVRETFTPGTHTGGEDGADGRGLRYIEWVFDADPTDTRYDGVFAFLLRDARGRITVETDRHQCGLYRRRDWLKWIAAAGFARVTSIVDPYRRDVFTGIRTPA